MKMRHDLFFKGICFFSCFVLITQPALFADSHPVNADEILSGVLQPSKSLNGEVLPENASSVKVQITTQEFLQGAPTLSAGDNANFEPIAESSDQNEVALASLNYDQERYRVEDVLPILEQGLPAAFVLDSIKTEDLEALKNLPFETALAILDHEIVLFTSGDRSEIKISQPVMNLLQDATGIVHFHVNGYEQDGPSQFDINHAVQSPQTEYVVTSQGVYSYNQDGVLNQDQPLSYEDFSTRYWGMVKDASLQNSNSVEVRSQLHQFISEMDQLQEVNQTDLLVYREAVQDTIPPTGSIQVNNGVPYTNSATVTLTLTAVDHYSPLDVTGDGQITPEDALAVITYINTYGTGPVNDSNRIYDVNSDHFISPLDVLTVINYINANGSGPASSGIDKMSFSTDGSTWTTPVAYSPTASLTLPSEDGVKTVSVKYYDVAGNVSPIYSADVTLDTTAPSMSGSINGGAPFTQQPQVTLDLNAVDSLSGLARIRFTTDPVNWTWSDWEDYQTTKSIILPEGDGNKQVYWQIFDNAWNLSSGNANIALDTTPPAVTMVINSGAAATSSPEVTLDLTATDSVSGLWKIRFTTDPVNWTWSEWEDYQPTKKMTLPSGDGKKQIYWQIFDNAWNLNAGYSEILLDTTPPQISMNINSGTSTTSSPSVTLNLWAEDEGGAGLLKVRFTTDPDNWTWSEWEDYQPTKNITLPSGDGNKRVYWQVYDKVWNLSSGYSDILLDTQVPIIDFKINSGDPATSSQFVTLNLSAIDSGSGLWKMRFSTDPSFGWSDWENYKPSVNYTLPAGSGAKRVYWQVFDNAWNLSTVYDDIYLAEPLY